MVGHASRSALCEIYWSKFDLKFEISEKKSLVKFWGRIFLPARKTLEISERLSGKFQELCFKFRVFVWKLRSAEGRW